MAHARSYASAVLNQDGNLWILGGTAEDQASDTTEVYEYAPRGEGIWRKGPQLPPDYRDTGIESHCTVRYHIRLVSFIKYLKMSTRVSSNDFYIGVRSKTFQDKRKGCVHGRWFLT